jgi:hypothetical protein
VISFYPGKNSGITTLEIGDELEVWIKRIVHKGDVNESDRFRPKDVFGEVNVAVETRKPRRRGRHENLRRPFDFKRQDRFSISLYHFFGPS